MNANTSAILWRVISGSARGAAHVRLGLPNQDARMTWAARGETGADAVLAISDGHGASRHFRSEVGARLAVETATSLLKQRIVREGAALLEQGSGALAPVLQEIVLGWQRAVTVHAGEHPIADEEWASLAQDPQPDDTRRAIEANITLAYGATLLAVVAMEQQIVYVQLGDGDILCVADDGRTSRPLPPDPRLAGNQTTSMCMPEAWREFRADIQKAPLPALILLSSDGYANSFRSDSDFLQIGPDYLQMLRQRGAAALSAELSDILGDASASGSGDDITLGLIAREDASAASVAVGRAAEATPEHRIALLQEQLADAQSVHRAELERVQTQYAAVKRRADRVTIALILSLAVAIGLAFPMLKRLLDGGVNVMTTAAGDRARPGAAPDKTGGEPRKPDPESLRPHPTKDGKTPLDKTSEPAASQGQADTGVTGGDHAEPKGAERPMILKVSNQGGSVDVTLDSGRKFHAEELGLEKKEFGNAIAHIVDVDNGARNIVNDSKKKWKYSEPGSDQEKSLAPQEAVRLKPGLVLKFGNGSKGVVS
jgi:hypothetical protein